MTFKVIQGHRKWRYLKGHISILLAYGMFLLTMFLSCTISEILPVLQHMLDMDIQ